MSKGRLDAVERAVKEFGHAPEDWERLAPAVAALSLQQIMDSTGYAISHASRIKTGKSRPHPRHWAALASAVDPGAALLAATSS